MWREVDIENADILFSVISFIMYNMKTDKKKYKL